MLLIKDGYLIDPKSHTEGYFDLLISDGKIVKIEENIDPSSVKELGLEKKDDTELQTISAKDMVIAPGLVDVHVHFRDPGFTHKEDIFTGAKAAAKGGFTSVVMMANTKPAFDNVETLQAALEKGKQTGIHIYACSNVTMGLKGEELTDMSELAKAGAVGFTDDGIPLVHADIARKAMERTAELKMPISFHEEDPALIENNGVNRGQASAHYGIGGSPREAEIGLIERDCKIALETGAKVIIQHISTKEGVELVRQARKQGADIHAEATPHHFTLTEEAVIKYGTNAKMNPPLRTPEDREAIIAGLQDGTIDLIATDHAPHAFEEKNQEITKAPSGIIGLETSLALGISELVEKGKLTMMQLLDKMCLQPSVVYGLDAGYLGENGPADLILIDCKKKEIFTEESILSKSHNTPFIGWELQGKIMMTVCDGEIVYQA